MGSPVPLNKNNIESAILHRFKNVIKELDGKSIRVGIKKGKTNEKGEEIASYARDNEFGVFSKGIPSRPFLRSTFNKDGQDKMAKRSFKAIKEAVLQEHGIDKALTRIGEQGAVMVRKNIRNGDFAPNAQSTLSRKTGGKPLIDSGAMIQSVESWIKKNG